MKITGPPWLTPADACQLVRALEPYELMWVEDPIAPDNIDGYRRRDAAHAPLAASERSATIFGERELIVKELVDVIQPDTGRAGGITQTKKIAAMAEAHHIQMAPHSGSLWPVAEYAALHLLAAIPNALILERLDDDWDGRRQTIVPHPVQVDGLIAVPDGPGFAAISTKRSSFAFRAAAISPFPCRKLPAPTIPEPTKSISTCRRASHAASISISRRTER
ncbi:L-alanine-DL-glutamate epimerase-like enolase superfamily enzyme [Rhizobium pisi]